MPPAKKPEVMFKMPRANLIDMCKALLAINTECRLTIGSEEIHAIMNDEAHVALVELTAGGAFIQDIQASENTTLALDVGRVYNEFIKVVKGDDIMAKYPYGKGYMRLTVDKLGRSIRPPDLSNSADPKFPDLKHDVSIRANRAEFLTVVKAAESVTTVLHLEVSKDNKLRIYGESEDDTVDGKMDDWEVDRLSNKKGVVRAMYELEFVKVIMTAIPCDTITVKFAANKPIEIEFFVNGLEGRYAIAPRVEED